MVASRKSTQHKSTPRKAAAKEKFALEIKDTSITINIDDAVRYSLLSTIAEAAKVNAETLATIARAAGNSPINAYGICVGEVNG